MGRLYRAIQAMKEIIAWTAGIESFVAFVVVVADGGGDLSIA